MDKNFGGVVWTNHALERLGLRGIKQSDAWATWNRPDQSRKGKALGSWVYYRRFGDEKIEVVAKKNTEGKWLILSVWSRKVYGNNIKRSFWNRIFGGYTDIFIPILASALFLSIFLITSIYSKSKVGENVTSQVSSATPEITITPSPTPTLTATPTMAPTVKPTAKPVTTTPVPQVNNVAPNAGYSRQSVSTDAGIFTVSIISADIGSTRVIVDTASGTDCSSNCPALSLAEYVTRNNGFAGVNGTYFCPKDYPSCAGKENTFDLLLMNKDKVYFNSGNNVYSSNPAVIFGQGYIRFVSSGSQWGRDTSPNGVLMNYPLLVFNKGITFGGNDDPKQGSKGARSFVANRGNVVYIGVVHSATVAESARVMKALDMDNAINLDDGGSTALWYGGYKVGPGRAIPNAIIFTR